MRVREGWRGGWALNCTSHCTLKWWTTRRTKTKGHTGTRRACSGVASHGGKGVCARTLPAPLCYGRLHQAPASNVLGPAGACGVQVAVVIEEEDGRHAIHIRISSHGAGALDLHVVLFKAIPACEPSGCSHMRMRKVSRAARAPRWRLARRSVTEEAWELTERTVHRGGAESSRPRRTLRPS